LKLDSREAMRAGGDSGPAVVPGKLDESLLLAALRYESYEMPPAGKLPEAVIADFQRWIELGAADPRDAPTSASAAEQPAIDVDAGREFWAFQPPRGHDPPPASEPDRIRSPIDAFVLARLEAEGLSPNEPASRATLVRRLYHDLIGLPPTPAEV